MKNENKLVSDVKDLAEQSITEEAIAKVQSLMDQAMSKLDAESQGILNEYFDGKTVEELSRMRGIEKSVMEAWIARSKRELINKLRSECRVRQ